MLFQILRVFLRVRKRLDVLKRGAVRGGEKKNGETRRNNAQPEREGFTVTKLQSDKSDGDLRDFNP